MNRMQKKERTKQKILSEALYLFREKGFDDTTVQEITEAANVAKGTFFNYFPTKESIMQSLAEDRLHQVESYIDKYALQRLALFSRIRAYVSYFLGEYQLNPQLTRKVWQHVVEHEVLLRSHWEQLLYDSEHRGEIKPHLDIRAWSHIMNSHFHYLLATSTAVNREEFIEEMMAMMYTSLHSITTKRGHETMKRVVILGGGYGGLRLLQRLLTNDLPADVEIVLIDKLPYHCMKTEYYALAAGTESDHQVRVPFPTHKQLRLQFGTIDRVDMDSNLVHMKGENPVAFDSLIVGLGCEDKFHEVPGAAEHTYSIQTMEATRKSYQVLNSLPANSSVSIVGAGLSGVELASELRESRSDLRIRLFDRGDTILPMFPNRLSKYVQKWFEDHQVEVISNSDITQVDEHTIYNHGEPLESDVIIWTAGIQPNKVVRDMDVEKDPRGRVILTPHHHLPDNKNVFVVGDCASLPHAPSAQLAEGQAEQIAMVLKKRWKGESIPETLPEIKLKGVLGSLGKKHGFGMMGEKAAVTGRVARMLKSGVLWMYKNHNGV